MKQIKEKQFKNICLVKFAVLGHKNTQKLLRIISTSDSKMISRGA